MVFCIKNTFFAEILFVDDTLSEDIILKAWEEAPQLICPDLSYDVCHLFSPLS